MINNDIKSNIMKIKNDEILVVIISQSVGVDQLRQRLYTKRNKRV